MLLRLGQVVDDEIRLSDVLVRAPMPGIELQRAPVVLEGELELAGAAVRVAEVVLNVRVACVAERRGGQPRDRGLPVLRGDGVLAGRIVRIEPGGGGIVRSGVGDRRRRQQPETETEQRDRNPEAGHTATCSPAVASGRATPARVESVSAQADATRPRDRMTAARELTA